MKSTQQGIFILFLALAVTSTAADDAQAIQDLCRWQIGNRAHPNPTLCFLYVQCQFFNGVVHECPPDNIFALGENCVAGNWITCARDVPGPEVPTWPTEPTESTWPTIPTIPEVPEIPDFDLICVGIDLGVRVNPLDCTTFVLCLFQQPNIMSCPDQTPVFDKSQDTCVIGNPVTCEIGQIPITIDPPTTNTDPNTPPTVTTHLPPVTNPTPPTLVPTTTTPGPINPGPPTGVCSGMIRGFIAHPDSCYQYFSCWWGTAALFSCPSDRIFVERLQGCALGNQQTCERNSNRPI